ncbi:hypothetical protein [Carboxylicivirga caseinilyticus]|uniref:hypothetical protein n=1 Tax=Carboxylicivirga caseinilyticus TaxID=3417572 RepID=UPI003D33C814|nr:hypothetical protein [Marinilabiliaceae bacterium A049]
MDKKLVIHIGYHKTGTTFLQNNIFSKTKEINYLGQPFVNMDIKKFFQDLKDCHDLLFDKNVFIQRFDRIIANIDQPGKPTLISLESIHSGIDWWGRELVVMANRIRQVFPNAKILIGIREQTSYIESLYKEYIVHGGRINWNYFLYHSHYFKYHLLPKLYYDKVIELYYYLFKKDNVHVYLHEELKNDANNTLTLINRFIGINKSNFEITSVYEGMSKKQSELVRFINSIFVIDSSEECHLRNGRYLDFSRSKKRRKIIKWIRSNLALNSKSKYVTSKDLNFIQELFKDSNSRLSKILNKELTLHGYLSK